MLGKVFDRIAAMQDKYTKTEKKLMQGLCEMNPQEIIYLSITELASELNVAEATVARFCQKLGYTGFQDFKLSLSREQGAEKPATTSIPERIAMKMHDAIEHTSKALDYDKCLEIADKIIGAGKVCAFGVGNSYIPAVEVCNSFIRVGINVVISADSHMQTICAGNMGAGDALILFSVSGSTKDIIDVASIAKQNGVTVIVITSYERSPLAKYADYILLTTFHEEVYEGGSLTTVASITYIIDVLFSAVHKKLGSSASERMRSSADSVSNKSI